MNKKFTVSASSFADSDKVDEADVIARACKGDTDAYRNLYDIHVGRVYALCLRLTGEQGLAEDATQEVFIQVWRKLQNFSGESQFSTWLYRVSVNVTISYQRKQKNWLQRMFNIEEAGGGQMVAPSCSSEVDLDALICKLPERARWVFVLHGIEGYRHEEIATMLNMAVGTSKAQYHRARQLLQGWMGS
ncbi:RNA polymerase sigma factor [Alteromonas sp. 14N.309.X.WAT.G.H12]|uniref:RNA polymerase sigma factor n=1 Tax=Alteromonas sp. 14N.309.X.WAT.G.H12 TaxID=3120824 RepID=UPI002FD0501D